MGVAKKGGFSHSAITEISTIDQEEPSSGLSASRMASFNKKSNFEDEFEFLGGNGDNWKTGNNNNSIDKEPSNSSWEKEFEVMKSTSKSSSSSKTDADNWLNSFDDQPKKSSNERMKRPETLSTTSSTFDSSKYSSAKAISSDMLFGNEKSS